MPRQRLGQHFLSNHAWCSRILDTLPSLPTAGSDAAGTWLEIGPGHGEMTRLLAAPGRRIVAVEADARLAAGLRERVAAEPHDWPGVEIVEADILQFDFARLGGERFRVYGNLPYYITSPILHRLFERANRIASIHIVIQLEVAARIVARPGRREYGYLSVACQFYTRPEIALRIPAGAFRPPPRVVSALAGMTLPGERASVAVGDECAFLRFVQGCFSQKRKTLRNNICALPRDLGAPSAPVQRRGARNLGELEPSERDGMIRTALADCGVRPDARAEQLSISQFAALYARLSSCAF
ncbi:MAG TPA: 16S rRNA (adenine(1518)-N(6)/adenine(1519)-N(6))-dimethyltransferase RsmA [Candidatus Acidoferrales bacterium]|nr:16S rRNA (adenine(1518)-N(6)/adenine(1519)-N(6))-dimethyltransferase RsmA [Candidatus Acidoferrales bacterium]